MKMVQLFIYCLFQETPDHPDGQPNLILYDLMTGKLIDSRVHMHMETWRPQWSLDSKLCIRIFQGEIQFYPDNKLGMFTNYSSLHAFVKAFEAFSSRC